MDDREGVDPERFWRKIYITPVGNLLAWIPNIPARLTLDKLSWMVHHPHYLAGQLTERLPQKKMSGPRDLREHRNRYRVFFEVPRNRIPRSAEIHRDFRCHHEPLLMPPTADFRRWSLQKKLRWFEAADERAVSRAADEVEVVKQIEYQRNELEKKRILLDNLKDTRKKAAVGQQVKEKEEIIFAPVKCWGQQAAPNGT